MRNINYIVLHCTAGSQKQTVPDLLHWWKTKPQLWKQVGYHWVIEADGTLTQLATDDEITNGVFGFNANSIHISYFGGLDLKTKKPIDNRTDAQKAAMLSIVKSYKLKYPNARILGHRDFPGVKKECPSFDVESWQIKVGLKSELRG